MPCAAETLSLEAIVNLRDAYGLGLSLASACPRANHVGASYTVDEQWEFPRENLILEQSLGEGEFGRVVLARARDIGGVRGFTTVAVKMLKGNWTPAEEQDLLSEFCMLKEVNHPNVIRLLGGCTTKGGPLYVIVEYAQLGSLLNVLRRSRHMAGGGADVTVVCNPTYMAQEPSLRALEENAEDPVLGPEIPSFSDLISFAYQIAKGMAYLAGHEDAADASALKILERIGANGDNSDLDLSDSEDSPDGAEANEQCDGILEEEEQDCHYDSDTDGDDCVSNSVMPSREKWLRKQVYASVLPDLPEVPSSTADERDGWYANQYYARYMDDQAFELLHKMTEVSYLQRTGRSLNSSPEEMKAFLGATLLMSCLGYPRARMYWGQGTRVAAVADKITRDRFFLIRSNLKVVDDLAVSDGEKEADRLWEVRPLLNIIRNACLKLPRSPNICVDEQIIPFTGKCPVKQFVPRKPNPTGLKNYVGKPSRPCPRF
ncbi:hypothetical protein MRX96_021128 [Rhipicephalus microplus]